ncbi:MAG: N-6 DNA methylase [Thermoplasmata archaeon]|nr:N-6 DNA methylase [Thermoplasmata archaeon]
MDSQVLIIQKGYLGSGKMPAPEEIKRIVQTYKEHRNEYLLPEYKEADARLYFIDIIFKELGWDFKNIDGYSEYYKEVELEPTLEIEGSNKNPDYAFKIGGHVKFYVEAKKPSVDITSKKEPAYQLRNYAWNKKLPLSILTNFEDLYVYDCRIEPKKDDPPHKGTVFYASFDDIEEKWDEFASLFSKESILKGRFDEYALKKKKGITEVDDKILKSIEGWRLKLAKNIAIENKKLTIEEMNLAVQKFIDRLLFLRICEDRGSEPENQLQNIIKRKGNYYKHLFVLFELADAKYNSGLFHFNEEKKRATKPDLISRKLKIDDKIIKEIIKEISESGYRFDVIPADILGQVYEQFLGKVIRLTAGHQAKVEEKPEVKKAGGVYYTPTYIVEYIVENTVVKLCEGKTPEEMKKLKILDPACGSGSFLIVAYKRLMEKHQEWYAAHNPKKYKEQVFQNDKGNWQLTLKEKKNILLSSIHGVDIDNQAVEVTKLNLLLKALEGENKDSLDNFGKWFREPALPNLENNVKCGNSLIDFDIIDHLQDLSDDERDNELARINPFNWQEEFSEIMKAGGFDAVVGNPPYIRIQTMKEWAPVEVEHYKRIYQSASKGNYDIYVVFIEKALQLINENGKMGYICPHKFFQAKYGQPIRELIDEGKHLEEIVNFNDLQIFSGATTYTCLLFLTGKKKNMFNYADVNDLLNWQINKEAPNGLINHPTGNSEWNFIVGSGAELFDKLSKIPTKLDSYAERLFQGCITSADTIFLFKEFKQSTEDTYKLYSKENEKWIILESKILKPVVRSGSIKRYKADPVVMVIFPYEVIGNDARLFSENEIKKNYPLTWQYLNSNKSTLENREKGRFRGDGWYRYGRTQNLGMWEQPKLMLPYMVTELSAYYDYSDNYYFINVTTGGYGITLDDSKKTLPYLCGLLNSRLLDFYLKVVSTNFHGGYFAANKQFIEQLPIRIIDFSNKEDVARHDKMVKLVERMLKLHKDVKGASTPDAETRIQRQIEATDREIDELVYELYGLTEEDIRIIEEKGGV